MKHSGRYDSSSIVFCHFLITLIKNCIITGILYYTSFQVVRNQQARYTTKILIGMHMAKKPAGRFHIFTGFSISITAAWKYCCKNICIIHITGNRILICKCGASPVNLHRFTRLMLDAHGCFCKTCPFTIVIAELGIHIWLSSRSITFTTVFSPKKREIYTRLSQFFMDIAIIWSFSWIDGI